MAMRTASPFWLSLVLLFGLFVVLLGEKLSPIPSMRVVLTGIGVTLVVLATAARIWSMNGATGSRKRIEKTLVACNVATVLALFLYAMTTDWGPESLQDGRGKAMATILWVIALIASLVPVLMIEVALGASLRSGFDLPGDPNAEANVDLLRVRDSAWSGLTIAFAMSLLMVTCRVATDRNAVKDASYFKTSMAGDSTQKIVKMSSEPIRAMLFFPETNEVTSYVKGYFDQLASDTNNMEVSLHDRYAEASLAAKYKVTRDGIVVLARGQETKEKFFTVDIPEKELKEPEKIRTSNTLRTWDGKVNKELVKLMRDKRKAYVMTGHGELNDPESVPSEKKGSIPERRTTKFKAQLADRNYEVKELGLIDMSKDIPDDAHIVFVLAPTAPLLDAEWEAIARYLDRGGRLLLAMDPKAHPSMGALEGKLGLKYNPLPLTDDVAHYPQTRGPGDKRFVITTQFSAHGSTTSLSRTVDKGLILIEAGALEDTPFVPATNAPKKTVTLRSMETTYQDVNDDLKFDAATEKKQRYNIGVAIEGNKTPEAKDGYRALVFSDADLFADAFVGGQGRAPTVILVSGPLLRDSIDWLGGEEVIAGEITTEEDKPIEHTKNEKAAWFLVTVIGVPLIVLGAGLGATLYLRRRRGTKVAAKKAEVKP